MDEENENNNLPATNDNKSGNLAEKGKEEAGKAIGDKLKKEAGKKAALKGKLAAMMGPVIFWASVVFVAIIIIIGIIMFFETMPGMVMEKIKAFIKAFAEGWSDYWGRDTTAKVDSQKIYSTLDYLKEMDYDVKGYGFLSDYYTEDDSEESIRDQIADEYDSDSGITRDINYKIEDGVVLIDDSSRDDDGRILLAKSEFLYAYFCSDNYVYTLRNQNYVNQGSILSRFWYRAKTWFGASLKQKMARGMVAIYKENGIGVASGSLYNADSLFNPDVMSLNPSTKKLKLTKGEFLGSATTIEYDLDGWTGRYGMPVEFLTSVHAATLMPDLAYDMATHFDTSVNVVLHVSSDQKEYAYKTPDGLVDVEDLGTNVNLEDDSLFDAFSVESITRSEYETRINIIIENLQRLGVDADKDTILVWARNDETFWSTYQNSMNNTEDWGNLDSVKAFFASDSTSFDELMNAVYCPSNLNGQNNSNTIGVNNVLNALLRVIKENYNISSLRNEIYDLISRKADVVKYYVPYIANVTKHWYRDVYYTITPSQENNGKKIVRNDYDYETVFNERWTLYKTDDDGNYKLYALAPNGKYAKNSSEIENYSDEVFEQEGEYFLFKGSEAEQKAILNGDIEGTRYNVAKMAETMDISDEDTFLDIGWNKYESKGGYWSAYKSETEGGSEWERLYTDDELVGEENSELMANIYYRITSYDVIKQTGEGQRIETNPDIKKMFLTNTYFKYDGMAPKAEVITALRKKLKDVSGVGDGNQYGPLNELGPAKIDVTNMEFSASDLGITDGQQDTYKVSDYAGQVILSQNSLEAFSMLEGTHTLDADYIYRDFKELVVELGYFTKEELTDETPKLLQWLVPDIGSGGFPSRSIDKREEEYGTMIHSEGDLNANREYALMEMVESEGEEDGDTEPEETVDPDETNPVQTANNAQTTLGTNQIGITDPRARATLGQSPSDGKTWVLNESLSGDGYSYGVELNGVTYLNYKQGQGSYSGLPFGGGNYASSACGPTSCAILASAYGSTNGPKFFGDKLGSPPSLSGVKEVLEAENIPGEYYHVSNSGGSTLSSGAQEVAQKMKEALEEGKPVIVLVGNSSATSQQYTSGGHYFVFIGMDGDTPIYCNTCSDTHEYEHRGSFSGSNLIEEFVYYYMQCSGRANRGIFIPDEAPTGVKQEGKAYTGYKGNEAVVSPVTGILLEYGTYSNEVDSITEVEYRENVDLKLGPSNAAELSEDEFASSIVSDKVGYAKILVLDEENYQKIENYLKPNTTIKDEIDDKFDNDSLLSDYGKYRELPSLTDKIQKSDMNLELKDFNEYDRTLYGYKEFGELYNKFGISGYTIFIDGFVCELPDTNLSSSSNISKEKPSGEELSMDVFKEAGVEDDADGKIMSLYQQDEKYKLGTKKATNKVEAERKLKGEAAGAVYIESEDIIVLKEGTVIGRTMTDMELLEGGEIRENSQYTYDQARENPESGKKKLIGNYIRIIMRDTDKTPVEDVEDYMKLDNLGKKTSNNDWELFYWLPFESGAADTTDSYVSGRYTGPVCVSTCSEGEVAIGIIQWTSLTSNGMCNQRDQFMPDMQELYPEFASSLSLLEGKDANWWWSDFKGSNEAQKLLYNVDQANHEEFLTAQMEIAKKEYLEPLIEKCPWIESKPSCVQGELMHLVIWCGMSKANEFDSWSSLSDEEILRKVRTTIANTGSTAGPASGDENSGRAWNEPEIGLAILSGKMNSDDVEQWVRNQDYSVLSDCGVDIH